MSLPKETCCYNGDQRRIKGGRDEQKFIAAYDRNLSLPTMENQNGVGAWEVDGQKVPKGGRPRC